MSLKENFTEHEWVALRTAPHLVVFATATAGASGIFGTIGEMMTAGKAVFEATAHPNELIRALAAKDEAEAAAKAIREDMKASDITNSHDWLRDQALAKCRQVMTILHMKSPEDQTAMADWLRDLARRVAEASKEGGFLGFGGVLVSDPEKAFLASLDGALA